MTLSMSNFMKSVFAIAALGVLTTSAFAAGIETKEKDLSRETDLRVEATQSKIIDQKVGPVSMRIRRQAEIDRIKNKAAENPNDVDARAALGIVKSYEQIDTLPGDQKAAVRTAMNALVPAAKGGNFQDAIYKVSQKTGASRDAIEKGCGE